MQTLVGAILIHRREDNAYIGGVGTEDKGRTMLVPWNQDWDYYSIGATSLAYMKRPS
jgi:hypothetical protein